MSKKKLQKNKQPPLTKLGKAIRYRDAKLVSGWDSYSGAVEAASAGNVARLVNLLRAHRRPDDDDFDQLADFIEAGAKHGHRQRDAAVHSAAALAEAIMDIGRDASGRVSASVRECAIKIACSQGQRELGKADDADRVRDLLNRPKSRRRPLLPKSRRSPP